MNANIFTATIATYNGAKYIREQLNSIITPLDKKDEIIDKYDIHLDRLFYTNKFSDNLFKNLIKNNFIGWTKAFTKATKNLILPFPKVIAIHDWWIDSCCKIHGIVFFIDKKLHFYRRHDINATKEKGEIFWIRLKWRVNLIKNLMFRYIKIHSTFNKTIK